MEKNISDFGFRIADLKRHRAGSKKQGVRIQNPGDKGHRAMPFEVGGALRLRLEAKTTPSRLFLFLPHTSHL
jgi:hypothetical protein